MYIKLPVTALRRLDLMILMVANPFRGPLEERGLEDRDFFGPEIAMRKASEIRAQKSRDIQGPPLPMVPVMDLPASKSLRPTPYKQQVQGTTGGVNTPERERLFYCRRVCTV
jgi:hypothetical protein